MGINAGGEGGDSVLESMLGGLDSVAEDVEGEKNKSAIIKLNAFIKAVEAQRGKKISEEDADALIESAQQVIDLLD